MGGTGYPDPAAVYTQPGYSERFGRGYFWETGKPSVNNIVPLDYGGGGITTPLPWLTDPTSGFNKYDYGCEYMNDLLVPRDDGKPGFSLKAMRPSSLADYRAFNQPGFTAADEVYTLRLESDDVFNGGLFAISVDWLPYGGGAWPAWWLVGSDPVDWVVEPPRRPGMGLRNYWPLRGEIDIIEYVNAYTKEEYAHGFRNHLTLHEPVGCHSNRSSPSGRGKLASGGDMFRDADPVWPESEAGGSDCAYGNAFTGCSISMGENTVGHPGFLGGIYVCDWIKDSHVDCWFFNKNESGTYSDTWEWPDSNKDPNWSETPVVLDYMNVNVTVNLIDGTKASLTGPGAADYGYLVLYFPQLDTAGDGWSGTHALTETNTPGQYHVRIERFQQGLFTFQVHVVHSAFGLDPRAGSLHTTASGSQIATNPVFTLDANQAGEYVYSVDIHLVPHLTGHTSNSVFSNIVVPVRHPAPPPPPSPPANYPPMPSLPQKHAPHTTSPIDFDTATHINVKDLGPPDIRHDLSVGCHSDNIPTPLADMRMILNTVVCGQWAGQIPTTAMDGDPDPLSYMPNYASARPMHVCEDNFKQYLASRNKRHGNRDYLHRRFEWDISWIKVFT